MDALGLPAETRCSVTFPDGSVLSAPTLPLLARVYAVTVLGDDEWSRMSSVEQAGASSAMFNELLRVFDVERALDQ